MNEFSVFLITFHGDIATKKMEAHASLEDALASLKDDHGYGEQNWQEGFTYENEWVEGYWETATPDPEDDRIVVWKCTPGEPVTAVWHFSGWHWDSEEFGIPQGTLPGNDKSLYDLAME